MKAHPSMFFDQAALRQSILRLVHWIEAHDCEGYDPGDGGNSFLHALTFGQPLLERLLQQGVCRSPVNVRPLLGIRPHTSTKGMGYIAWGYTKMFQLTANACYAERARRCLNWLLENRSGGGGDFCWGNHFSFTTRAGRIPKGEPTIVWSSLIGEAFIEAWERLGDDRFLDVADRVCRWILGLPREKTSSGDCLSYVPSRQSSLHNSNMLGAGLLARVGVRTGNARMRETAREAMLYSCSRQRPDGSWFYGEEPKYHWIDNFHTGYNLDSLRRYSDAMPGGGFARQLEIGLEFFKRRFFEPGGCPKYYHDRRRPVDIQCAAQAIDTLTFFSDRDGEAAELARKVAAWTIGRMQDADGHFYYRDLGWMRVKTPMLHWGQGTMFKALAHLALRAVPEQGKNGGTNGPVSRAGREAGVR